MNDGNENQAGKKSFFEFFTEILGAFQIAASPLLIGIIVGFLIYVSAPNNTRLVISIAVAIAHLAVGITWATSVWKKQGTINFMSWLSATPEFDNTNDAGTSFK